APESFAYQIALQPGQYLKQLDSGAIAVIDPTIPSISSQRGAVDLGADQSGGVDDGSFTPGFESDGTTTDPWQLPDSDFDDLTPADPDVSSNQTQSNYDSENRWLHYADQDADGQEVGLITPPWAKDAAGVDVPTNHAITGSS